MLQNVLLPIVSVLVLCVVIYLVSRRAADPKARIYDERQTAVLGKAYKAGFATATIGELLGAFVIAYDESGKLPFDAAFLMVTIAMIAIFVYAFAAIWGGAYFGLSNNWKTPTLVLLLMGILQIVLGISRIADGLENGKLTIINISLPLGIVMLILAVVAYITVHADNEES